MKIKINAVEFEVEPVTAQVRQVLLTDPTMAQGVWRRVWAWDVLSQTGTALTGMTEKKGVPLGNGITFFVPRLGPQGQMLKNEGPSKKMAERVLKATGATTITELMAALNRILHMPQKTLPLDAFAPLDKVASYEVRMYVDFAAVHLVNTARNLSAYLLMPGQVAFVHEITAIPDQAAYDAVLAETPALAAIQPAFVVPPRTKANLGLRTLAVGSALSELQDDIRAAGGPDAASDAQKRRATHLAAEWRVLRSAEAMAAGQQPGARPRPAPAPVGRLT